MTISQETCLYPCTSETYEDGEVCGGSLGVILLNFTGHTKISNINLEIFLRLRLVSAMK